MTTVKSIPLVNNRNILKQVIATIAACFLSMTGGITFGFTAVLLPQLRKDKHYPYDKAFDSWLAAIAPFAMIAGCIISGPMSDAIGRRRGQQLLVFPFVIGWIVMGFANNNETMLAGRFITGFCTGSLRPLGTVFIGEVSDPKYRSVTLFCPGLAVFVGSLISHTVGSYVHWRIACFVFGVPTIFCFITLLWLKESPLWLLAKGKKEQGIESFRWYRGEGESAEKELKSVLENQDNETMSISKQFDIIFTKPFMKSIASIFFVFVAVQMSGINTITFYSQELFEDTFGGDVDAFMLMIATDLIRAMSSCILIFLAKLLPRRTTYIVCCYATILLLVGLCVYLYIKPSYFVWVGITCLVLYIAVASIMASSSWTFVAEIFPSKVRGIGSGISSCMSFCLLSISVKLTPIVMSKYGDVAMYGGFAAFTLVSAVILSFILPETNGKSLQEIENTLYNKDNKKDSKNDATIITHV